MTHEHAWTVSHNPQRSRFEATVEGELCEAAYRADGRRLVMTHTSVPPALQGRGIARSLIDAAVAHARTHGLKIEPQCSYVAGYMRRHPEARDVLA